MGDFLRCTDEIDSVDTLVEYIEGLGTQFSCFDSCLQGETVRLDYGVQVACTDCFSQLQGGWRSQGELRSATDL